MYFFFFLTLECQTVLCFTFDTWQKPESRNKMWRNAYRNAAVITFFWHWFSSSKILQQKLVVMTVFTTCFIGATCIFCFGRTGILGYAITRSN